MLSCLDQGVEPSVGRDSDFARNGWTQIRALATSGWCASFLDWMCRQIATGQITSGDKGVPNCFAFPQPAFQLQLLAMFRPEIEKRVGRGLRPSYAYARLYLAGAELHPHRDRKECELTATVSLSPFADQIWPICVEGKDGSEHKFLLSQGDALVLDGRQLLHWRPPLASAWHPQLFLHFLWEQATRPVTPND